MSSNTHCTLFRYGIFSTLNTYKSKTTGREQALYISNDGSTNTFLFPGLELHVRYNCRVIALNRHNSLFPIPY